MPALQDLARRIQSLLGRAAEAPPPATATTTVGVADATWTALYSHYFALSSERVAIYDDMDDMEARMTEVGRGLSDLAGCATISADGSEVNFRVEYDQDPPPEAQAVIDRLLDDTQLREKSFAIARETLKYGDKFLQVVVDRGLRVRRVMSMPVRSMRRNEDELGLLKEGTQPGEWAFEQRREKSGQFLAGFYPWQIVHVRWDRQGEDRYGRPLLYSSRGDFKRLRAMEESLTLNWLSRAFARLAFYIDVTGQSPAEAKKTIEEFRKSLLKRKVEAGSLQDEPLTVIRDIFMGVGYHTDLTAGEAKPSLDKVEVMDTSNAGFTNLNPVDYYRSKVIMGLREPKAYLGLEADVNAKATLIEEELMMARMLRMLQMLLSEAYTQIIDLGLILAGFDPRAVGYKLVWPNPSRTDDKAQSETAKNYAAADTAYRDAEVIDSEWIAKKRLGMDDEEWRQLADRIRAQAAEKAAQDERRLQLALAARTQPAPGAGRAARGSVEEARAPRLSLIRTQAGPPREWVQATDLYEEELATLVRSAGEDTARAIADAARYDPDQVRTKLDDYLGVLLVLLMQKGWQDLPIAFWLGFGPKVEDEATRAAIRAEIANNDHFLETSFMADLRGTLEGRLAGLLILLKPGRPDDELLEQIRAGILDVFGRFDARIRQYAGQFWHSIHEGYAERTIREERAGRPAPVFWNLDPLAHHCRTCPQFGADPPGREYASMSALLVATGGILPGQGTECDGNCRCWLS